MLKILNTFAQFNKQLWVLFLLRCVKIHPMKLLFNQNHFVAEFVFRQTVFASVKNLFYILISFFFLMEKSVLSAEKMQLNQKHFHIYKNIPLSFPIFCLALSTSFF